MSYEQPNPPEGGKSINTSNDFNDEGKHSFDQF